MNSNPYRVVLGDSGRPCLVEPLFDCFINNRKAFSISRDKVVYKQEPWGWSFDRIETKSGAYQIQDFTIIERSDGTAKIDLHLEKVEALPKSA